MHVCMFTVSALCQQPAHRCHTLESILKLSTARSSSEKTLSKTRKGINFIPDKIFYLKSNDVVAFYFLNSSKLFLFLCWSSKQRTRTWVTWLSGWSTLRDQAERCSVATMSWRCSWHEILATPLWTTLAQVIAEIQTTRLPAYSACYFKWISNFPFKQKTIYQYK